MNITDIDIYIDKILKNCGDTGFNVRNLLRELDLDIDLSPQVKSSMLSMNYVETYGNLPVILTNFGKKVRDSGGHISHIEKLEKDKASKFEKDRLEVESLRTTIRQNTFLYKTRWLTYIALLVSIISLFKDCTSNKT